MKGWQKITLITTAALLVITVLAAGGLYWWAGSAYEKPGPLRQETTLVLPRGKGVNAIAKKLGRKSVISRPWLFRYYVWKDGRSLKAGEYQFPARISPREVVDMLAEGKVVIRKVTVPEGLSSDDVLARLRAAEGLTGDAPLSVPEGSLLPETYHYTFGDTRESIVDQMRQAMDKTLATLWEKRAPNLPLRSKEEALILASIVEKETGVADERGQVAAVFINRLNKDMRLQSDPTALYGITGGRALGREAMAEDIKHESLYNTYIIDGLPPGPICNPGRSALEAVLNPPSTNALYFVADGQGGHRFAATLQEHNQNINKLRKLQRQQRQSGDR